MQSKLDTNQSSFYLQLQASFKENMGSIKSNFDSLDKRMQVLKK